MSKIELAESRFWQLRCLVLWSTLLVMGHPTGAQSQQSHNGGSQRTLFRAPLQAATNDPFSPFVAVPPPPQKQTRIPAAVVTPVPVAAPLPHPVAPAVELTFLGRLDLGQEVQVFALHQGRTVWLKAGEALPNGYVVQSVNKREVQLRYASLDQVTRWPLPAAPIFETH